MTTSSLSSSWTQLWVRIEQRRRKRTKSASSPEKTDGSIGFLRSKRHNSRASTQLDDPESLVACGQSHIKPLDEMAFTNTSLDRKRFLTFPCQKTGSAEKPALVHRYRGHTAKYWPFMRHGETQQNYDQRRQLHRSTAQTSEASKLADPGDLEAKFWFQDYLSENSERETAAPP